VEVDKNIVARSVRPLRYLYFIAASHLTRDSATLRVVSEKLRPFALACSGFSIEPARSSAMR
jgi:hypothetical protein